MKFAHLIETLELGGVMRNLETLMEHMGDVEHKRYAVTPRLQLPPQIPADELAIIHFTASWSKLPFLGALRAMRKRAPIVIVEHSYTESYERFNCPSQMRFRTMLRLVYSFADRVVAVSHGQANWLRTCGAVDPAKVVVIPSSTYCGDLMKVAPLTRRGKTDAPLRIGAFGRYHEQKGYGNLIHAMRAVSPEVATLTLAGLGPYEERLKALGAHMPHVTVGGPTHDVPGFLAAHDIIAMPSRWESFGQVALEARAAARPLISCSVDGLIEQTGPEWGWLVPADDIPGLSEAITASASADLHTMGLAARQSAIGHLDKSLDAWRALGHELLDPAAALHAAA